DLPPAALRAVQFAHLRNFVIEVPETHMSREYRPLDEYDRLKTRLNSDRPYGKYHLQIEESISPRAELRVVIVNVIALAVYTGLWTGVLLLYIHFILG